MLIDGFENKRQSINLIDNGSAWLELVISN